MEIQSEKKEIVKYFLQRGILINKELAQKLQTKEAEELNNKIKSGDILNLDQEIAEFLNTKTNTTMDWQGVEKLKVNLEKKNELEKYKKTLDSIEPEKPKKNANRKVKIIQSYKATPRKINARPA